MAGAKIVSIRDSSAEIRTSVLAVRQFSKESRKRLNEWTRSTFAPEWQKEVQLSVHSAGAPMFLMNQGVRMKAGNPPQFLAGGIKRRVTGKRSGGGLHPIYHWPGFEYGATQRKSVYDRRSKLGKMHRVERNAVKHLPKRTKQGRVYGEATRYFIPRVISGWTQYTLRMFYDALEAGMRE